MIVIKDKHECCGCSACGQVCPRQCISFLKDVEGFSYPKVDTEKCIDCGLCERVCPVLNKQDKEKPLKTVAAINKDAKVRSQSSSGGIFFALAEKIIEEGGKVYGACFAHDLSVIHCGSDSIKEISKFRGSKYLQSAIGDTFKNVRSDLEKGLKVLFSGTPCQVAGLRNFLHKDYDNLMAVDFICHGVPSPSVWQSYIRTYKEVCVKTVSFRDKREGWHRFGMNFIGVSKKDSSDWQCFGVFPEDPYMRVFLSNLSLRPSCYDCPAKAGRSGSDVTLGDFWGIEHIDPALDDDKGTSLVLLNTTKGQDLFNTLDVASKEEPLDKAIEYNPSITTSVAEPDIRSKFFDIFIKSGFSKAYKATMVPTLSNRIKSKAKRIVGCLIGEKGKKIVRILRE